MSSATRHFVMPPTAASVLQALQDGTPPTTLPDGDTRCLAVLAIDIGDAAAVAALVATSFPLDQHELPGAIRDETLLHRLVRTEPRIRPLEILLEAGADARSPALDGTTTLHALAAGSQRADRSDIPVILDLLLRHGASVAARDGLGRTPLHTAAADGTAALVRELVARGADPHARDRMDATPWQSTTIWGNHEQAVALLESGAVPILGPGNHRHRDACAGQLDELARRSGGMPPHLVDWLVGQMTDPELAPWAIERLQRLGPSGSDGAPRR